MYILKQDWCTLERWVIADPGNGGSIQLEIYKGFQTDGVKAYVSRLWVDKEHRRKGCADKLLAECERIVKENGVLSVYLAWDAADTPRWVKSWYERKGYVATSRRQADWSDEVWLMRKDLLKQN